VIPTRCGERGGRVMDVCLMIEGQEGVSWEQWVALALGCEEQGFQGLFRSDHYVSFSHPAERGTLDAWATLAALAPQTSRIRLGTLVSPATFRHPSQLAKVVVTADHASGGRVELGMGAGWFDGEHTAYGFPFPPVPERFDILEEQVEIVHRLWDRDEDEVTFTGKHYQLKGCYSLPRPVQDPHPPLIIGGHAGKRSLGMAAQWADEYNTSGQTPEECRKIKESLAKACEAADRDPDALPVSLMTFTMVASDRGELETKAGRLLERRGESGDPAAWLAGLGPERLRGTPDQILELLAQYEEAGVTRIMMQHLLHDDLEALALIGKEIIPQAADL
jgi:F420-dependent oxidoreductase-like protein